MRPEEICTDELLELGGDTGLLRFAGDRAVIVDAGALGVLRRYVCENFGAAAARTLLTQFGFAQGWLLAEAVRAQFVGVTDDEWRQAGMRVHGLGGFFNAEPGEVTRAGVALRSSWEAEQHVRHFGPSDAAACWTVCGLVSSYVSRTAGHLTYVFEDTCVAKGDAGCHIVGRTREQLGAADQRGRPHVASRPGELFDVPLERVVETLGSLARKHPAPVRPRPLPARAPPDASGIVCHSEVMKRVVDLARRVAKVDSTVLISGESGTGKERIARLVHDESPRAQGPFVAVNCGAMTETLLESELFGHARGAFTGASHDRVGLFETANGGTILLDEVGEVSPAMQVRLLRTLQEREVRRVGESRSRAVDVRVVAATNRNLGHRVEGGAFRRDLYYRLKVIELHVPPLSARGEDILPLARALLAEAAKRMKRNVSGLAPRVAELIVQYGWPGNVRELGNAMERAVALARGRRVEVEDLPEEVRIAPPTRGPPPGSLTAPTG